MKEDLERYFIKLAKFPTPADHDGFTPSAKANFLPCAQYIRDSLLEIGIDQVEMSTEGYVYATVRATDGYEDKPVIALMAHYDTALENPPSVNQKVEPKVWQNYASGDLELSEEVIIRSDELKDKVGHTIITGDGVVQLGADDKAGVAVMLAFAKFLLQQDVQHPTIKLIFNHNEEVGRGVEFLDYEKLGANYAYCVDGGAVGELFIENFNAEAVAITIEGVTVHPGYAKGMMVNAITIANELITNLAAKFLAPENSSNRESYLGLNSISGTWTKLNMHYLLRAFDQEEIENMRSTIESEVNTLARKYEIKIRTEWDKHHKYHNSGQILKDFPELNKKAEQAYQNVGVEVIPDLVRGGFDGVNMSFAGLPTTNVFNGAMNMHGLNEWVTLEDMELSVKMLLELARIWTL